MAAKAVGQEQLAARVQLAVGDDVVAQGLVKATWSNDSELTAQIDPQVAHYTGQTELAAMIQEGLAAKAAGDEATATTKLGRAVQLAAETGNDEATSKLRKVVDIEDEKAGTVRLKRGRRQGRRDGARHRLDQDHPGQEVTRPARPATRPTATDYCDVCGIADGARRHGAAPPDDTADVRHAADPAADGRPPTAPARTARRANPTDALFCEACGYDFTTGTMPRTAAAAGRCAVGRPGHAGRRRQPVGHAQPPAGWPRSGSTPTGTPTRRAPTRCPRPGLPTVVPLKHASILIGRASRSRNITPDIDLSSDNGISRRHAQLTTDGTRWWVEDLGSSNGTYVGGSVGAAADRRRSRRARSRRSPPTTGSTSAPGPGS